MSDEIIKQQLVKLPINYNDDFFLKYKPTLNKEYAKSLVDKTVYFTWKHEVLNSTSNKLEVIKEYVSGKVLDYKDNKLLIYTQYVFMLEEDLNDPNNLQDSAFIQEIPLEDITDIAEFTRYELKGWEILSNDYYGKVYNITSTQNKSITALAYNFDGNYLYLAYKNKNNEINTNKYPICLISKMTII